MFKKNLPKTKLKSYGLRALAEKISRQPIIGCAAWLLVAMRTQIYNERSRLRKQNYKMYSLRRKRRTRKKFKEEPDAKRYKGIVKRN